MRPVSPVSERIRSPSGSASRLQMACGHTRVISSAASTSYVAPNSVKRLSGWSRPIGRASALRGRRAVRIAGTAEHVRPCTVVVFRNHVDPRASRAKLGVLLRVDPPVGVHQRHDRKLVENDENDGCVGRHRPGRGRRGDVLPDERADRARQKQGEKQDRRGAQDREEAPHRSAPGIEAGPRDAEDERACQQRADGQVYRRVEDLHREQATRIST